MKNYFRNCYKKEIVQGSIRKLLIQDIGNKSRCLIFFILFYLYLWLIVDLRLIYNCTEVITNFPVFYKGWTFFYELLSHPGGLVEYIGAFLSELFYVGWAGALVVTIQSWLISFFFGRILNALNLSQLCGLRFIPPILLLITYTQYTYHFITTLAYLVTLVFIYLYLRAEHSLNSNIHRLIVFLVLSVILYMIAAGAYLFFVAVCAIYELLLRRRYMLGFSCLLSAVVIPYVEGILIFGASIINAYCDLSPFSWKILTYESRRKLIVIIFIIYSLLPLIMLAAILRSKLQNLKITNRLNTSSTRLKFKTCPMVLKWIIKSLILFAIAFVTILFSYDKEKEILFKIDFYAHKRMWPELLRTARQHPNNYFIVHAANRALYHTGQLSYEMFCFPQNPATLFLNTKKYENKSYKKSALYLDIGLVNMAEKSLTDSLEGCGERPSILKGLALINLAKANYDSARIYLGALSKTLFYNDWANNYLERLKSDPKLSGDKEIQRLCLLSMDKDYGFTSLKNIELTLLQLLEKNRQNRMAFEYLMSWYLLNGRLEKFAQNLNRLDDFNLTKIPRLYEEAVLIYVVSTRKPVNLYGREVSTESRNRFEVFNQLMNKYGKNNPAIHSKLAKDYWNSYLFYYVYGLQRSEQ